MIVALSVALPMAATFEVELCGARLIPLPSSYWSAELARLSRADAPRSSIARLLGVCCIGAFSLIQSGGPSFAIYLFPRFMKHAFREMTISLVRDVL